MSASVLCNYRTQIACFDDIIVESYPQTTYHMTSKTFDHTLFGRYQKYQQSVAKVIPVEAERPHVIVDCGRRNAQRHIVLVGGMGCLSDASISYAVARSIKDGGIRITVISAPPPRHSLTRMPLFAKCVIDILTTTTAGDARPRECYLLSNTIHTVFDSIQTALALTVPTLALYNLVKTSAQFLRKKYAKKINTILLMTTKVSWSAKMYENLLSDFKILRASSREIDHIQTTVDMGKKGIESYERIQAYIEKKIPIDPSSTLIFMGCTDFTFTVPAGKSLTSFLQKSFPGSGAVVDSDKLFSQLIAGGPEK